MSIRIFVSKLSLKVPPCRYVEQNKCFGVHKWNYRGVFNIHQWNREYSVKALNIKNFENFSKEDSVKILSAVNTKPVEELAKYNISKQRLDKLQLWRSKYGQFTAIDQMLEIDGFGIKVLSRFLESVLNDKVTEPKQPKIVNHRKTTTFTIPILTEEVRRDIKTCVALHIGVHSVSWTHLQANNHQVSEILDWKHCDLSDNKPHINDLVQTVLHIDDLIPKADCYVLENPQVAQAVQPGSPVQININVQKSQIIGMISSILANRSKASIYLYNPNDKLRPTVFFFKSLLASKLYRTLVGTERVSTESAVNEILKNPTGKVMNSVTSSSNSELIVNPGLIAVYDKAERYQKEYMGQSLLLGMSFLRLMVLQCQMSIDLVSSTK